MGPDPNDKDLPKRRLCEDAGGDRSAWVYDPRTSKGLRRPPDARGEAGNPPSPIVSRRNHPGRSPGFGLLASRTVRQPMSVALSHPVCGHLLLSPPETNTTSVTYPPVHIHRRSRGCFTSLRGGRWQTFGDPSLVCVILNLLF